MTDHTRTEKIGGDSIFMFVVIQVERETVMTAWRLHWGPLESQANILSYVVFIVIRMLNLSAVIICIIVMYCLVFQLWHFILLCLNNCGVIYCCACE